MKKSFFSLMFILMFVSSMLGCSKLEPPVPVPAILPCKLLAGESTAFAVSNATTASSLEWYASAGQLTPAQGPTVTYTAPQNYSGLVIISVIAKKGNAEEKGEMTCEIIAPTPTPTSTPTATMTPSPTLTPLPTATLTPPPPMLELFFQSTGAKEFIYKNNGGELTALVLPSPNCIHSGIYGMQISYDMKGNGNGGWGVHWDEAPGKHFDASQYSALTFWVKGASGGETFQIGIRDTNKVEYKLESVAVVVVTQNWSRVSAPFTSFVGVNVSSIANINLGFNSNHRSGSICIDDFAFE